MSMDAYHRAKEAYEQADELWAANTRQVHQPALLAAHHARMAPLAAACRDAATSEYDRCWWDTRWHGHWVAGEPKQIPARQPVKPPAQLGLFGEQ